MDHIPSRHKEALYNILGQIILEIDYYPKLLHSEEFQELKLSILKKIQIKENNKFGLSYALFKKADELSRSTEFTKAIAQNNLALVLEKHLNLSQDLFTQNKIEIKKEILQHIKSRNKINKVLGRDEHFNYYHYKSYCRKYDNFPHI